MIGKHEPLERFGGRLKPGIPVEQEGDPLKRESHHGESYLEANEMLKVECHNWAKASDAGIFFCLAMIVMKVARAFNDPQHLDNWVDIIGYARLAQGHIERSTK